MKLTTCICSLFFLVSFACKGQDTLIWKQDQKLQFSDFLARPKDSDHGASSMVGIRYHLSFDKDSVITDVSCYFLRNKSWIRKGDSMLQHEQGHFDIGELFARKLKIAFAASGGRDYKSIFNRIKKEKHEMSLLYDKETEFSKNKEEQRIWNNKISRELAGLKQYANK